MAKVVFHSRFTEHEIVRRPKNQIPLPMGGGWQTVGDPRISFQFHAAPAPDGSGLIGVCVVQEGRNKLVDGDGWLASGAEQKPRDDVEALRAHNAFLTDFWESGHAPGTKYPRPVDWHAEVTAAAVGLDEETLVRLIAEERGSHHRADLIEAAETALAHVRAALAAAAQEPEAPKTKAKATA